MDNRTCVDPLTYSILLQNQIDYYLRIGVENAEAIARQNISAAFTTTEEAAASAYKKDHDDARRDDWTTR